MVRFLEILFYYHISRVYSKVLGYFAHIYLPKVFRSTIVGWYAWSTSSRVHEAVKSLDEFENLYQFFTREIRARPVAEQDLVAPVDCTILAQGSLVEEGWRVRQIKGITYPVEAILGLSPDETTAFKDLADLRFISIHLNAIAFAPLAIGA